MQTRPALDYLTQHEPQFIEQLSTYVRYPSVSAQPHHTKDVAACAEWITNHCRQIGLEATLHTTAGNPIILARTPRTTANRPHFIVYGHYDVQPAEPLELWTSPPFEPRIVGRSLFARGASDNKGQHFAHLKGVEALLRTKAELPCDLTFLIEGEEEVGSEHLPAFLRKHRDELACDAVIISDNGIPSLKHPALTYALRGICAFEIQVDGPSRDLHSGIYGGSVDNPAMVLAELLAKVRDRHGRIAIPGFYDDVVPLTKFERQQLARVPYSDRAYRKHLGVTDLFGERGFTSVERRSARPTFEINGLTSGYQGEGSKTIIPSWARAKITCRLVPNQTPEKLRRTVFKYLKSICPPSVRLTIIPGHGGTPYLVAPTSPMAEAAQRALHAAHGYPAVLTREGGSIPIVNEFKQILGVDTLLLGLALPDDNPHSPNEKFDLDMFARGMALGVYLWPELSATCRPPGARSTARKSSRRR